MAESTHKMETPVFPNRNTSVPVNWCAMCKDLDRFFTAIWNKIRQSEGFYFFYVIPMAFYSSRVTFQCTFLLMLSNVHYTEIQKQWVWIQDFSSEVYLVSPRISMSFVYLYGKDKVTAALLYKSLPFPSSCATPTTHTRTRSSLSDSPCTLDHCKFHL